MKKELTINTLKEYLQNHINKWEEEMESVRLNHSINQRWKIYYFNDTNSKIKTFQQMIDEDVDNYFE